MRVTIEITRYNIRSFLSQRQILRKSEGNKQKRQERRSEGVRERRDTIEPIQENTLYKPPNHTTQAIKPHYTKSTHFLLRDSLKIISHGA